MEWLTSIKMAIDFMEDHMTESITPGDVADHVNMSCIYLQKGFQIMTGYTLGEYMRNRKLYLAAVDLQHGDCSVIDIALKYGYENQSSFDKAFARFHGVTPREAQKSAQITSFLPLTLNIQIQGGENMKFRVEEKDSIAVIGFRRNFLAEDAYEKIPKFWDEIIERFCPHLMKGEAPAGGLEHYIAEHHIGEFGICVNDVDSNESFDYLIAGYAGEGFDEPPIDMARFTIPAGTWAVFECTMKTLQDTNTKIWKEWMPGNPQYEITGQFDVEWYSPEGMPGPDRKCEIWIPVTAKK